MLARFCVIGREISQAWYIWSSVSCSLILVRHPSTHSGASTMRIGGEFHAGMFILLAALWPSALPEGLRLPAYLVNGAVLATVWYRSSSPRIGFYSGLSAIAGTMLTGCANITIIAAIPVLAVAYVRGAWATVEGFSLGRAHTQTAWQRIVASHASSEAAVPTCEVDPADADLIQPGDRTWWERASVEELRQLDAVESMFRDPMVRVLTADPRIPPDAAQRLIRQRFPSFYLRPEDRAVAGSASEDDAKLPYLMKRRVHGYVSVLAKNSGVLAQATSFNAVVRNAARRGELPDITT